MKRDLFYSVGWNLALITLGTTLFALGTKAVAIPHNFMPGGLFGLGSLLYYATGRLDPGTWFFLLNIPLFAFAWRHIGRRFCGYSLYAMFAISGLYQLIDFTLPLDNELYAAVAAGVICGAGSGTVLRSLGSNGGLDVIAVWLNQRFNLAVGRVYFGFNLALFLTGAIWLDPDRVVASLILVFLAAATVDYVLSLFNQRKLALIISEQLPEIARRVMAELRQGATFLTGSGAYTLERRDVLLTVVNTLQLKKLEEIVFTTDPKALFVVENTFSVIGSGFSRRKVY